MDGVPQALVHLFWIVPLALLLLFLSSPRFRGDIAGTRVSRVLAQGLDSRHYTILNRVRLPSGGGSICIDHLVISKFGVFVIASEYARGEVAGGEFQDRWKRHHLGRIKRFDNPLHRSRLQAEAVQKLLGYPESRVKPILVLCGHDAFKGGLLPGIVTPEHLIPRLRKFGEHLLTEEQVQSALKLLRESELPVRKGVFVDVWGVLRWALFVALVAGAWYAFRDDLATLVKPEQPVEPRTEQQRREDSLVCAFSTDTGRCACYDPQGERMQLPMEDCRRLAEKGSVLKQ